MRKTLPFWSLVRSYTAVVSAFIYNLNIFGLSAKNICSPGFNCHGCPWATFSCPVGVIGYGLGVRALPAFALGSVLAIGVLLGRLVCGYACPFGLLQDLLFRIKTRKFSLPRSFRYLKYIVMILTVFVLTYLFGFEVEKGYIRINKPVVAKDTPELDITIFAEKNRDYFSTGGYNVIQSDGGFPLPEGLAGGSAAGGLTPIGVGGGDPFALESLVQEDIAVTDDPFAQSESGIGGISPLTPVGAVSGSGSLSDLLNDEVETELQSGVADGGESVFDRLERTKEETYRDTELLVEVTVDNLSQYPLDEIVLTPVYYEHGTGNELWRGDDMRITARIEPSDSYTTEIFTVPYYLHKADIVILSEQTKVEMNYWTLFCTYCPVAAIEADIPNKLAGIDDISQVVYATTQINTARLIITVIVIIGSIFFSRFFCRGLCPLGAMYGVVARFAVVKVVLDKDKCIDCEKCDTVCPVELDVRKEVGGSECISCGDCVKVCPVSALKRKAGL